MEQKYYYSPHFTGECYRILPEGQPLFEKSVSNAGLLDLLELRLGLPCTEKSPIERILAYQSALGSVAKGAFFEDAFQRDPLATAKEILLWRDVLVMEGFEADKEYSCPRLKTLAQAENSFSLSGTPERWKKVHASADGKSIGHDIAVHYDISLLPKLIRETLKKIGVENGLYDGLGEREISLGDSKKEITIRNFSSVAQAYSWAVENNSSQAVICSDTLRLNAVLRNREKPIVEASAGGDSPILQLFRLGLLLLERPVNVGNLLEFLRASHSPIPAEQRYSLFWTLKSEGGRGKKWKEKISSFNNVPEVQTFLTSLLDADISVEGKKSLVPKEVVTDWCLSLAKWSKEMITADRLPYQMGLIGLCQSMCQVVENEPDDKVDVDYILKAMKTLYNPGPVPKDKASADSWNVVASHRCFIDSPESLLWLKCNGKLDTAYPYSFLFQEEVEELNLRRKTDFIRYDFNLLVQLLGKVKKIELCACDFDCDDALEEHPAVTICKQADKKVRKEVDMRDSVERFTSGIFTPSITLDTGTDMYPKRKGSNGEETSEDMPLSATSIETLIGFPFDFALSKKLEFQDLSSLLMPEMTPTQGTVAHYVFERMLKDTGGDIPKMRSLLQEEVFTKRVDEAAKEKGEILFLPENRTSLFHFKDTVRTSIGTLLDILKDSGLSPKDSEVKLNEELDGISLISGSVDFYALTRKGEIVVIDFKYSKGTDCTEKLKQDKSVQLEIYSEALQKKLKKNAVAKAYYFFPANMLCTDDESGLFKGKGVVPIKKEKKPAPLADRIRNSISFRKEQLTSGILEMGEGSPLEDIDYHNKAMDGNMIDIPSTGGKDNKVKKTSPFATPTKYPILKDFIK